MSDKTNVGGAAAGELRSYIERWERLDQERKALASDQKDLMKEAKDKGFCPKAMKAIIKERAQDKEKLAEFEELKDVYRHALGDLSDTPLGEAAIERSAPKRVHYRDGKIAVHPDDVKMSIGFADGEQIALTHAQIKRARATVDLELAKRGLEQAHH